VLFHSVGFAVFFLLVFPAFVISPHRARWVVLLLASLIFFAALGVPALMVALAAVTLVSYALARLIGTPGRAAGTWLWTGIVFNVLVLAAFKFLPPAWFGTSAAGPMLTAVGVSYFTFQGISYLVDVYTGTQKPERHLGYFALYMAFFPKVLQGPIERAGELLPQLRRPWEPDLEAFRAGALLFAWGLFKKVVVADNAGPLVEAVYGSVTSYQGPPLALGTYLFAIQLYCDFSGYTDMALGIARCFGINLTRNFDNPYGARSIVEFWRRWHISFSRWVFDYIFNPLQLVLRDLRTTGVVIAVIATFAISGIWHGVGATFLVWGMIHALYMSVSITTRAVRKRWHERIWRGRPRLGRAWQVFATAHLVMLSWIFFRAESLDDAVYVLTHLATGISGTRAFLHETDRSALVFVIAGAAAVGWVDMGGRGHRVETLLARPVWVRWTAYYALAFAVLLFGAEARAAFIYFQF
jgi:D-alanyl-lipoteichoic acid acyltransferase DltB (MBOAT superfamily)